MDPEMRVRIKVIVLARELGGGGGRRRRHSRGSVHRGRVHLGHVDALMRKRGCSCLDVRAWMFVLRFPYLGDAMSDGETKTKIRTRSRIQKDLKDSEKMCSPLASLTRVGGCT